MTNSKPFKDYYAEINPIPFYTMIGLFVFSNMLMIVNFIEQIAETIVLVRLGVNTVLLILCVMYIAFNLLLWKLETKTFLIVAGLIALVGFGWNFIGQTNEFFCTIVASLLAVLAYQRDFKIILKIVLVCHILTMIVGAMGLPLGYSEYAFKIDTSTIEKGNSLGLIYPNHVGRMSFLVFVIAWYLWGQRRRIFTTIVSFLAAMIMIYIIKCKTVAVFFIAFPICWWIITFFKDRDDERNQAISRILKRAFSGISIALPFLAMGITYLLGLQRQFFMTHWHYGQGIYALWMRFISAGILFSVYGFPLLGRDILSESAPIEFNAGQIYMANIIDNAYIYYLIAIGGIALIACMLWLSFGAYRALKNKDLAILLIYFFMCGYGLIEVVFFQFEHNFLFFYPLTATALAYKNKPTVPEAEPDWADTESGVSCAGADESDTEFDEGSNDSIIEIEAEDKDMNV